MENLRVKLVNGYEFDVDEVMENKGDTPNAKILTMRMPIKSNINQIEESLTADNLKTISVVGDNKVISEFDGYTVVQSVTKIINKFSQIFNITLRAESEAE